MEWLYIVNIEPNNLQVPIARFFRAMKQHYISVLVRVYFFLDRAFLDQFVVGFDVHVE